MGSYGFVFCVRSAIYRVVIWCCGCKLSSTGIYHLVCGCDLVALTESLDVCLCSSAEVCDHVVREFHAFRLKKKFFCQRLGPECLFHLYQDRDLVDEPSVDLGDPVDVFLGNISADRFCDLPDTAVIYNCQLVDQLVFIKSCKIVGHQAVHVLLQRTDSFHECTLKVMADTHNLTGSFHLSSQCSLSCDEFIKWKSRDLDYTVVKHRLETCVCLACDRIRDLIEGISKSDLCCNFGDRVTGCLTCQCGRTAYTRVYLDNTVLEALRMKGVLYVTSTCDTKLCDDVQSGSTEHLIFLVSKCLGRCDYDGVTGMDTNRIDVFHVADCDAVSCTVTHYFVFNFFPSCDAAFYQNFSYTGKSESVLEDLSQFIFVVGNTAAASAKGVSRTENDRITDGSGKCDTIFYGCYDLGSCDRLANLFHGVLEFLTVLCLLDGLCSGTDQAHIVFLEEPFFFQFHCKVQTGLSSKSRKNAVRFLLEDELFYNFYSKRLDVNFVRDIFVCHNGCRVGVQKNYFHAFFLERAACLCTCIVEFCCLTDDNRTGANYKNFVDIFISRHDLFLPSFP